MDLAETIETSCSTDRPPNSNPTRNFSISPWTPPLVIFPGAPILRPGFARWARGGDDTPRALFAPFGQRLTLFVPLRNLAA